MKNPVDATNKISELSTEFTTLYNNEILPNLNEQQKEILQKLDGVGNLETIQEKSESISAIIDEFSMTLDSNQIELLLEKI